MAAWDEEPQSGWVGAAEEMRVCRHQAHLCVVVVLRQCVRVEMLPNTPQLDRMGGEAGAWA